MPNAATNLSRRGQKMRNGRTSSTKNMAPVAKFQHASRQLCGIPRERRRQRLSQKVIATAPRGPTRWDRRSISLTTPDMNMKRNKSQRASQMPGVVAQAHEQRDKRRLQQERVPLEGHEGLPGIEQREIERIDQHKAEAREEIEDQHERQRGSAPADGLNGEHRCRSARTPSAPGRSAPLRSAGRRHRPVRRAAGCRGCR